MSWWQRFVQMELPYAAIGLIWNSMMSVAGGWFFLMACEMFVLGNRDLRLPGLGSYLQTAANAGDTRAILWGSASMIAVIVLIDQLIWRPVIAWGEKFKVRAGGSRRDADVADPRSAAALAPAVAVASEWITTPAREALKLHFAQSTHVPITRNQRSARESAGIQSRIVASLALLYGVVRMFGMIAGVPRPELAQHLAGRRRNVPARGVTLVARRAVDHPGRRLSSDCGRRLSAIAQPIAQIAASVPATALFPIVLLVLIRVGGGLGIGSIVLLLLGTQWYILFNVIAGACAIPTDLKEVCERLPAAASAERWRKLFLPGDLPLSDHRLRHRVGRRLERQHRRGVLPLPRADLSRRLDWAR